MTVRSLSTSFLLSASFLLSICLLGASGCSSWKSPSFDLSHLRDPRATDIDGRLSAPVPVRTASAKEN